MIKAEWTNKDALDVQPTCNKLATSDVAACFENTETFQAIDARIARLIKGDEDERWKS